MSASRVFLLRHGESTFNASWVAGEGDPGIRDGGLTPRGREQVKAVAGIVRAVAPELVVTSPATRALETTVGLFAEPASRPPIHVEPLVRDRFVGDSCDYGRPREDLQEAFPGLLFGHLEETWWLPTMEEGVTETRAAFAARVSALEDWLYGQRESTILVVGHEGTFRVMTGLRLANCELVQWADERPEAIRRR